MAGSPFEQSQISLRAAAERYGSLGYVPPVPDGRQAGIGLQRYQSNTVDEVPDGAAEEEAIALDRSEDDRRPAAEVSVTGVAGAAALQETLAALERAGQEHRI